MSAGEPTDDATIGDNQVVWRRIYQAVEDENLKCKRPTSASFLQDSAEGPVSVYIASEAESAEAVMREGREPYLASLTVSFIRQLGLGVVRDSSSGGPGHAVLVGRKTRALRNKMAKEAAWVAPYAP